MTVSVQLVREIRRFSGGCCEYCLLGENDRSIGFQIDHIVPVKHGGEDRNDNLCLACAECNGYKGPNVAALGTLTLSLRRMGKLLDLRPKAAQPSSY